MNDNNQLTLDIRETLTFFDEQPEDSIGHATALALLMGEDLASAAFLHCLGNAGGKNLGILPGTVKRTGKYGPWLDRWISANYRGRDLLFQAEVKSTSAHGMTGVPVPICIPKDQLQEQKWKAWSREWDSSRRTFRDSNYRKVLVRMDPPEDYVSGRELIPLLLCWRLLGAPKDDGIEHIVDDGHLFRVNEPSSIPYPQSPDRPTLVMDFKELWVFSVSSYFRSLLDSGESKIRLNMPEAQARLGFLNKIVHRP